MQKDCTKIGPSVPKVEVVEKVRVKELSSAPDTAIEAVVVAHDDHWQGQPAPLSEKLIQTWRRFYEKSIFLSVIVAL
ncbi:hypothetical protein T265_04196 [Opisthorchis viverrini]|uniref:Uncharacterized protein n=1 Tax=Opisthorchis viverrini TaxID=6198 RepID=A0A074ZPT8_OPIVI|nr:hypothetical protein T265_04196 [Opisthorchis viverrini]KER29106.1 hypothetical protein T265_04196 [Opisthorchis viverrini]